MNIVTPCKMEQIYTCPMHPEISQDRPGLCSDCGMNLIPSKTARPAPTVKKADHLKQTGHDKHAGHRTASFLKKFWISLVLTIPIFFYSELALALFKLQAPKFVGSDYMLLLLGSFVFFYCGLIFLTSAYRELKARLPGMMTLIAIAITTAYLYSFFSILFRTGHDLLFELSSLITIMLLGHWLEMRSVQSAQGALKELAKLLPDQAELIRDQTIKIVPLTELRVGDLILVKPGAKVPADGKIVDGQSELNEAVITGESKPIEKTSGDKVIAGSINGDGSIKVEIEKIGDNTFLAGVMRLVADAQASKSRLQLLSDRAAFYLTIIAVVGGAITFVAWLLAQAGIVTATERLVAVLVITCPHALGLAVPLVTSISTTLAARHGLLVRERQALELARTINTVLFDKTGTLTRGEFGLDTIIVSAGESENDVLAAAASINSQSEHPLAQAIIKAAERKKIKLLPVADFSRVAGQGAKGRINGTNVFVGNDSFFRENNIQPSSEYQNKVEALSRQGKTIVHVIVDKKLLGGIALIDVIRDESRAAIKTLQGLGLKIAMITGDSDEVAAWVASELGLDEYFARVRPEQKAAKVKLLQAKGQVVAMVGDGINDAPALTQADLGIAIGAGTNVALESAGIILVRSDPRDIAKIFKLSRLTYQKMIQNLFWAAGYNIVAIPLAAGVLVSKGIVLQPAVAAILMSLSTVIVAFNAMLLKNKKL